MESTIRCPPGLPATVTIPSPVLFRTEMHGMVATIGLSAAWVKARAAVGLLPGNTVHAAVTLPYGGRHDVAAMVAHVHRRGKTVQLTWNCPAAAFLDDVSTWLGHGGVSPVRLKAAGLPAGRVADIVRYDLAETTELPAIRELRLRAHQHLGRLRGLSSADVESPYDEHGCHIVGRHPAGLAAYLRVLFVDRDPARSEYAAVGHVVPRWLWRAGFAEVGAAVVDPDFQGAGAYPRLVQHAVRVAAATGHAYLVGACADAQLSMYRDCGFRVLETRQVEPLAGWSFRSHLIQLDLVALIAGELTGQDTAELAAAARYSPDLAA